MWDVASYSVAPNPTPKPRENRVLKNKEHNRYHNTMGSGPKPGRKAIELPPYVGMRKNCHIRRKGMKKSSDTFIDCHDIFCCNFIILAFCFSTLASFFLSLLRCACLNSSVHFLISFLHARSCPGFVNKRLTKVVRKVRNTQSRRTKIVAAGACGVNSQSMNHAMYMLCYPVLPFVCRGGF